MTLQVDAEKTVTSAEIATELNVTEETVRVKARAGLIPGFQIGGRWRFYPSRVREALQPSKDPWSQPAASLRARRR